MQTWGGFCRLLCHKLSESLHVPKHLSTSLHEGYSEPQPCHWLSLLLLTLWSVGSRIISTPPLHPQIRPGEAGDGTHTEVHTRAAAVQEGPELPSAEGMAWRRGLQMFWRGSQMSDLTCQQYWLSLSLFLQKIISVFISPSFHGGQKHF